MADISGYSDTYLTELTGEQLYNLLVDALSDSFAMIINGEEKLEDIKKNKSSLKDVISKIITGIEYEKLDDEKDDLGYKYNLNDRLKKNNEILIGVLTGIYDENKIEEIFSKIDFEHKDKIEEAIGKLTEGISLIKLDILKNFKFNVDNELDLSSNLSEIERAIKGLVVSFIAGDIKSSIKMASMKGGKINIDNNFIQDLVTAYDKIASDFVKNIIDDNNPNNDGDYKNLNLLKT